MIQNLLKNKVLFWLGTVHLFVCLILTFYSFFNDVVVLGINSMIKPIKFALSIWAYSWTMALILNYVADTKKVKIYAWVAVVCMSFEQIAITLQATKGELSHFNHATVFGTILFSLMGVFILTVTLWTAYITSVFIKQKSYNLPPATVLSIKIGLIYFVIFSLFGGYISSLPGHTVGSADGSTGLWFLNWSVLYGDLRVAHFFGIHSLQIIPLLGVAVSKYFDSPKSVKTVKTYSFIYFIVVTLTLIQGVLGLPFIK